jgi:hypothetical protein
MLPAYLKLASAAGGNTQLDDWAVFLTLFTNVFLNICKIGGASDCVVLLSQTTTVMVSEASELASSMLEHVAKMI